MHGSVCFRNANHMCRSQRSGKEENSQFERITRPVDLERSGFKGRTSLGRCLSAVGRPDRLKEFGKRQRNDP